MKSRLWDAVSACLFTLVTTLRTSINATIARLMLLVAGCLVAATVNAQMIQRANLDGSEVTNLVTGLVAPPEDIALDVGGGQMYWTDGGKIQRANLDGSGVTDLVTGLVLPRGIALDVEAGHIYFTSSARHTGGLSGTIKTTDGTDICAMVLASGDYTFSCNPPGVFSLGGLLPEDDGMVKRQIYAHGFFPKIDTFDLRNEDVVNEDVVMTRSGACPSYNTPYDPGFFPDSAGKRIEISGLVLLQDTQTPTCAMVLANGRYMFSCDGTGSYALNIPLDTNGQFKLQVYADGFAPTIQIFDEFSPVNDVRMARAAECQ